MVSEPGSIRDLGFAMDFVDMSWFYYTVADRVDCMHAKVIMVRGQCGGRRRGARGGGVMPPATSTLEGSNPQGGKQVLGKEHISIGDVVGMMRSF